MSVENIRVSLSEKKTKMSGITLSEKYGVNPSVEICTACGKDMGVVLFGAAYKDKEGKTAEAPRQVCMGNVCPECQKVIDQGGIFFIEVRKGSQTNPYRTGRLVAINNEAAERIFGEIKSKINYLEDDAFEKLFGEYIK